jgi:hypothetical protein
MARRSSIRHLMKIGCRSLSRAALEKTSNNNGSLKNSSRFEAKKTTLLKFRKSALSVDLSIRTITKQPLGNDVKLVGFSSGV